MKTLFIEHFYKNVKYLLQYDSKLLKSIDNSNRTALHYAFGIRNQPIIAILISYRINKFARDSKFLLAEEYELDEVINDDWFGVKNFKEKQTHGSRAIELFMMCFQFKKFKLAIEDNNLDHLKKLNEKLNIYNLSIIDFPILKRSLQDEDSISLIEIAMKFRSYSAFRYILEQYYDHFTFSSKYVDKLKKKHLDLYLSNLREKAEDLELYEIIDIIDNTIEDKEIAEITLDDRDNAHNNELMIQNILKKKVNSSTQLLKMPRLNDNVQNVQTEETSSKETKICSIL
ncbi:hypothetical protein BpHYR1_015846 [Brachionus plicatilis]|uniref:Uncharacterized protein n=1 Tax=Brachionus plicatilis TaxID=10195 RepID=A0A3M7P4K7_BRAPC|nr:hypothetical protein BpHYR1_015846 [Brachionus plicatilis]